MSTIPAAYEDLLTKKIPLASLATLMADGTPQVTPVWFDYTGGKIRVNTARGRVKDKNMMNNPNVALSIVDPENPYRHLSMRGKIVKSTTDGADAHIDSLAKKYLGKDTYPFRRQGEVRVLYEIEILSASSMG
jgi:PPOX class probable F420-dependent enzyme